jgi:UDP-N-acetyl-D-galactosamine dehydrogenase
MKLKISVLGLGYVGLPIAVKLSEKFDVTGYDIDKNRIRELNQYIDNTKEVSTIQLKKKKLKFTSNLKEIQNSNFFIVTVPTPVNKKNKPNLKHLINVSIQIGKMLKKNDVVVYESTTFPGCTEEVCIPLLEKHSKLKINNDFYCGFSPERINPGDKKHVLKKINKIISGSNNVACSKIEKVYSKVTNKKIIRVDNIRIAESAKIIENIQRDINIALMNELSMLFHVMNIDFTKVLEAASTKWNFMNFKPGIVGGHCISVDPYYLADKASKVNFKTNLILSGRKINDKMGEYISKKVIQIFKKKKLIKKKILIIGTTFKENVPDIRNSQSIKIINSLIENGFKVSTFDPIKNINIKKVNYIKNFNMLNKYQNYFSGILILVSHDVIKQKGYVYYKKLLTKNSVFFDIKNIFDKKGVDFKL